MMPAGSDKSILKLLTQGSTDEDDPMCRASNHMHNLLNNGGVRLLYLDIANMSVGVLQIATEKDTAQGKLSEQGSMGRRTTVKGTRSISNYKSLTPHILVGK